MLPMDGTVKGGVDTIETVRGTTVMDSGETTGMKHMVRGCTVDHHPVAAAVPSGTMGRVREIFKVHPMTLLRAYPVPMTVSGEAIGGAGGAGVHLHHDSLHHHRPSQTHLRERSSITQQMCWVLR